MQVLTVETKMNVKNLVKSFFKTSDNLCTLKAVDGGIDNIVRSETGSKMNKIPFKDKYRAILKKHISVAFVTSEKNKLSKTKKNKVAKKEVPIPKKTITILDERSWFIKRFEIEVGKNISEETVPFSTLEKDIVRRKESENEKHLYQEYKEAPRPDDVPDIVWNGPLLDCCFCISHMDYCDCKGDIVLPPRRLPIGIYWKFMLWLHYIHRKKCFKKLKLNIPKLPEKPFLERLKEHLDAEAVVQKQLKEMDLNRGPEFCIFRCYNYHVPLATESSSYFKLKKELYELYYKPAPIIVKKEPPPRPPEPPSIADEIIDGLYRTVATQATTDENCEFVMGEISHILFGAANVLQDIEGTPYCVCTYQKCATKKPEPMVKKMQNLLSLSGIKKRVSNLTDSLMSSIVVIEDTGIPINTRATQDPPLDYDFESIVVPLKYQFIKVTEEEVCPCCTKYKELRTVETDQIEDNVIDNYDNFKIKGWESPFDTQQVERRKLLNCGDANPNILGRQVLNKDNLFSEARRDTKHENESKVRNINDNMDFLKRGFLTDKPDKECKPVVGIKDLFAIQSESMLNLEKTTKQDTRVHQIRSLEYLESIKPCCIDNLFKTLERKISDENFLKNLLEDQVYRRVARYIYKKKQKQDLENISIDTLDINSDDEEIDDDLTEAGRKIKKVFKSLKSKLNINMNKFSEFMKKQKSSLKSFVKKIQDAHLRSQSRKAVSLEEFKVNISKSLKKMNKAVSSFFKRYCKKSSFNIKQLMASFKKDTDKVDSLDDSECKDACDTSQNPSQNIADTRNSKTSEKEEEVFCVQYNSTLNILSKNSNQ